MTVIAFDGKTIASDSLSVIDDAYKATGNKKKLHNINGKLYGLAGEVDAIVQMLEYFRNPVSPKPTIEGSAVALEVHEDGSVFCYRDTLVREKIQAPVAIGCAYMIALGVMKAGGSAKRAVEVACEIDIHCGVPVQTMEFYKGNVIEEVTEDERIDYQETGCGDIGNLPQNAGPKSFSKTPQLTISKIENCRRSLSERESERTRKEIEVMGKRLEQLVETVCHLETLVVG